MFEGFSYLIALLLVIAAIAFLFNTPIAGLKPHFGTRRAAPSRGVRAATGGVFTAAACFFVWMGLNAKPVLLWLSS